MLHTRRKDPDVSVFHDMLSKHVLEEFPLANIRVPLDPIFRLQAGFFGPQTPFRFVGVVAKQTAHVGCRDACFAPIQPFGAGLSEVYELHGSLHKKRGEANTRDGPSRVEVDQAAVRTFMKVRTVCEASASSCDTRPVWTLPAMVLMAVSKAAPPCWRAWLM